MKTLTIAGLTYVVRKYVPRTVFVKRWRVASLMERGRLRGYAVVERAGRTYVAHEFVNGAWAIAR